jgi:predicted transposase YdaD
MTVQKILPSRIEPGSIADQLINEGKQRGRIEGRTEGRTEGRMEGRQEGLLEGFIQGEIRLIRALQKILGVAVSDADSLSNQSLEQLQALSRDLQAQAEKPKTS